mmetsp:Transcript_21495/g.47226  ORF Transcript_21495/g.47226 Transcript_21495/m.47226 type:complete len:259 (+) Transcript_21495:1304-2080(+)
MCKISDCGRQAQPGRAKTPGGLRTSGAPLQTLSRLRVKVINLERRRDRWRRVSQRLLRSGLQFGRFAAVNPAGGDRVPPSEVAKTWCTTRNSEYANNILPHQVVAMSASERGCAASHVRLWQLVAATNKALLVLEDDAQPLARFGTRFAHAIRDVPRGGVLYLGWTRAAPLGPPVHPDSEVFHASYLWTTVAYMIWPRAARRLLARLPVDQPIDNFLACSICDGFVDGYAVWPKLVKQAGGWDVGSDVVHSADGAVAS